ncbi:hypothetical protein GQF56_11795 [Rhodobacter sphaeroides]|jgi:hypothetical protein|uniref:Uncharacterized protein n=1 Tax=Cereibacter sphaeroides (strain ATCC 17023 / DSM 158 / JCM 6121 / CCUG 31486 / LMG 2827 / NBRC 12203 / NCIMB 8253 / ATH 2.4.1.) TaxID=272943 RepID=U5NMR6_CERS4|nr:hypothetical protein RSP_7514 [Cereibacter sphaeroides 2.4.1]AXC60458.1 hypothetical protein DQL45_03460 [Cereibacter sphaeroides 2.4.1]MVX48555.1 hypothetical protein [Cereibacter sphaeroides]QHA10532.1 hypothetical protein GQR99_03465 [Cereibacter sphaeroides]QHA12770.1 hypothetical protein GQY06_03450 [Cereibacter sphaeroides]
MSAEKEQVRAAPPVGVLCRALRGSRGHER